MGHEESSLNVNPEHYHSAGAIPAVAEEVADMAEAWAGLFVGGRTSSATASYGIAGVAASVLVCACPRHALFAPS